MTRRLACSLAVLAVGALLIGGCGGSSDTEKFKQDYKAIRQELRAIGKDIGAAIQGASGQTDAALAQTFNSIAARTQTVLDRLRKLKPPDSVKSDFDNLKAALDKG